MNGLSSAVVVIAVFLLWALHRRTRDVPCFARRLSVGGITGTAIAFVAWVLIKPAPESGLNIFFVTVISVMLTTSIIGLAIKIQHRAAIMRATRR